MLNTAAIPATVLPTRVVSVRGKRPVERFLYVGRSVRGTPWQASIWGNPIMLIQGKLEFDQHRVSWDWFHKQQAEAPTSSAVIMHQRWLLTQPSLLRRLPELRGLCLGCWCVNGFSVADANISDPGPIACHAVTLAINAERQALGMPLLSE